MVLDQCEGHCLSPWARRVWIGSNLDKATGYRQTISNAERSSPRDVFYDENGLDGRFERSAEDDLIAEASPAASNSTVRRRIQESQRIIRSSDFGAAIVSERSGGSPDDGGCKGSSQFRHLEVRHRFRIAPIVEQSEWITLFPQLQPRTRAGWLVVRLAWNRNAAFVCQGQ